MKKKVTIFGSTGSVGVSTLDIITAHKEKFEIVGLTINQNYKKFDNYYDSTFKEWRDKKSAEFLIENIVEPKYFAQLLCISENTMTSLKKETQIPIEVFKNLALY